MLVCYRDSVLQRQCVSVLQRQCVTETVFYRDSVSQCVRETVCYRDTVLQCVTESVTVCYRILLGLDLIDYITKPSMVYCWIMQCHAG